MADLIKIKPRKNYEWNQDQKFVYLQVPLPAHTSLKKVEIYLSDLILRVTSLEKKSTHLLDLAYQVDYKSSENKFLLTDGMLHVTLKKVQAGEQWKSVILEDISLADLKIRRRESQHRYEQNIKDIQIHKEQLRHQYDRKATQELMRFEQEERNKLENRKNQEKDHAIQEIFSNINENTGKIEKNKHVLHQETKWKQRQRIALELIEKEEEQESNQLYQDKKIKRQEKIIEQVKKKYEKSKISASNLSNSMFSEEDVKKYDEMRENIGEVEYEQIPVRKENSQKVQFSQRVYPHLAARDTFYKDAPMPKNKSGKHDQTSDIDNKNPLWLKDKGDKFFHEKNYISAIDAYTEALKHDTKYFKAYMNRTLAYMKVFKLKQALSDCEQCLALMQVQLVSSEPIEATKSQRQLLKIKTRKAICLGWKGNLTKSKELMRQITQQRDIPEEIKIQVMGCLDGITQREQSLRLKLKGDELVKINNHELALPYYQRSIEIDENQYAISNKILCLNKMQSYQEAVLLADQAIKKVHLFNVEITTREDKTIGLILLKLYYRKAKALEQLHQIDQAQDAVRKGLNLDQQDQDLIQYLKHLKHLQNKQQVQLFKTEAANLIKEAKHQEALQVYAKCLKMLESSEDTQEYLSILQNQCVCYLKLQQYDSIISTSIRILKIINNLQSKIVAFGGKRNAIIEKEELDKISIRTFMRRANAYVKTNQVYNAKADLEKALEISPKDPNITKELDKLKNQLNI